MCNESTISTHSGPSSGAHLTHEETTSQRKTLEKTHDTPLGEYLYHAHTEGCMYFSYTCSILKIALCDLEAPVFPRLSYEHKVLRGNSTGG